MRVLLLSAALIGASIPAHADSRADRVAPTHGGASIEVCYNYACATRAQVSFEADDLEPVRTALASAIDAPGERDAIAAAVAALYRHAGAQTPIAADRAGNFLDGGVDGRMDCIDHATTTTRLLALLESRGWLRFHTVRERARRTRFIFQHLSAVIEEIAPRARPAAGSPSAPMPDHVGVLLALCDCEGLLEELSPPETPAPDAAARPGARFAVDSWFVDHGEAAVILPLAEWLNGEGPNVQ